ncbi:hypothetical protein MKX01_031017 [Papaver californicum]|nr:hypothetical protein MKX01_031017 [Papaver californicum]
MLATAPLNLPFSIKTTTTSSPNLNIICSCKFESAGFQFNNHNKKTRGVLVRSSGYIRKDLDTPGAYQLIDDETGERVIVWGDDDSPIPSKETLKWKPNQTRGRPTSNQEEEVVKNKKKSIKNITSENGGYVKTAAAPVISTKNDDSLAVRRNIAGSFGKLKAMSVNALIRKSSLTKETNGKVGLRKEVLKRDAPYDGSRFDDSERRFVKKETSVGATQQRRSISRVSRQRENEDIMPDVETVVSASEQDFNPKRIMRNILRDKGTMSEPHDYDYNEVDEPAVSVPRRASDASLSGWGGGVSVYDASYETRHYLKHPKKISVGHGFFSRKTFQDLGCSDDVIESLRGQNCSRPSHIQAMAFVPVSEGKTCIIADQSGSGKTLAYLAPVSSPGSPRVVILVPTAELGSQCNLDGYLLDKITKQVHYYTSFYASFTRIFELLDSVLVDCSGDDRMEKTPETAFENKKSALLRLLEGNLVFRTIIFCNKIETCRKVENILNRYDRKGVRIRGLPFHSALTQEARLANMKEFLNPHSTEDSLFLICTDRASRGIDFMGGVDHVILFDFTRDPSEYVRRVGRTARGAGGGRGKAFVFKAGFTCTKNS